MRVTITTDYALGIAFLRRCPVWNSFRNWLA